MLVESSISLTREKVWLSVALNKKKEGISLLLCTFSKHISRFCFLPQFGNVHDFSCIALFTSKSGEWELPKIVTATCFMRLGARTAPANTRHSPGYVSVVDKISPFLGVITIPLGAGLLDSTV